MGINFGYRGEVLTGQGEMGFLVDSQRHVLLSSEAPVIGQTPLRLPDSRFPAPALVCRRGGIGAFEKEAIAWPDLPTRDMTFTPLQPRVEEAFFGP